ncbi:hypothetical protein OSTOST_07366 [Ostertagia ostertagi]
MDAPRTSTTVIPFNGPISLSDAAVASPSRSVQRNPSEAERTRFSSSPLPWHRNEPSNEYNSWKTTADCSPSANSFDSRSVYDNDLFPGRPIAQRSRKNFWEP